MTSLADRALLGLGVALGLVPLAGCQSSSTGGMCKVDSDCEAGTACNDKVCVPRASDQQRWAVELVPKSESRWARTEQAGVTFPADPVTLMVEKETMVDGSILDLDVKGLAMTAAVRVLLSFPSGIGAADRLLEAPASSRSAAGPVEFSIGVPESAIGQSANIRIVPISPIDKILPVWSVPLATLGPTVTLSIPKSNDLYTVEGVLLGALGATEPVLDYAARAFVGDRLVSNVDKTLNQGHFTLHIPKAVNPDTVSLELAPADTTTVRPTMVVKLSSAKLNVGSLRLPPFSKPQPIDVPVTAMGTSKKLSGVTVRFYTVLPGAVGTDVIATLRREFQTDKNGVAHAQILPGNAGETRSYGVVAIPPPDSEFAARCFPSFAVAAASGTQARVGASLELLPKVEITGQVFDGDGGPLKGVILTATRKDSTYVDECGGEVTSATPTATTADDGTYRLLVEPGTYRFEYEPATGSVSPLLVEDGVVVARATERSVILQPGALAEGIVATPEDGSPAAACEVRVFAPGRDGAPPELRARTRTAVDGRFRVILPRTP